MDYENLEDFREHLIDKKYNYYEILASYGLDGWIVAKEYHVFN